MTTAIKVELQLADGSFTSGMLRAGQTVAQFNQQLVKTNPALANIAKNNGNLITSIARSDGVTKDFLGTLRDLSIVTGVISMGVGAVSGVMNGWVGEIVRVNAEMQRMQIMMRGMSRSTDPIKEAGDNVKYLRDMAMNTPFSLEALSSGFVKLQSTGIDPMAGSMQSLADGIAAFGGSDAQFERAVVAITQMSGKGVIQMEELRQQLGEHMPRAVELMARSMGVGIAELLDEIGKGTMAAKPALDAFYTELERTYGGRAQSMMQTFEGQMKQTATLWTNLVTQIGGMNQTTYEFAEDGLFMTITDQLRDLNEILAQPFAFDFAKQVGAGMADVVHLIRGAITTLIEFRREIQFVATALAVGFAGRTAIAGVTQLTGAFGVLMQQMKLFKIEMLSAGSWLATGAAGFRSMSTAAIGTQMTLIGVGTAIKGIGGAIMVAMPWVAAVGLAVYAAAEYFDVFGNRVRNAYEDLKEFGAESRKQAQEGVEARQQQLLAQIENAKRDLDEAKDMMGRGVWMQDDVEMARRQAALDSATAAYEKFATESVEILREAGIREDEAIAAKFQRTTDLTIEARQRLYDAEARQIQDDHDAKLKEAGVNVDQVEESRRKALYDARMRQLTDNEEYFRTLLKQNEEFDTAGQEALIERQKRERGIIDANLIQITNSRRELEKAGADGIGIEHFANPEGAKDAMAKGQEALADMRREIQEMQLELHGATDAHAKLQVSIANGDYGTIAEGGDAVATLHAQLLETIKAKEALDQLLESRTEAEEDVEKARKEALERQFELLVEMKELQEGRKLLPSEINQLKLDTGYYEGLGPTEKITQAVDALVKEFGNVELGSADAGVAIRDEAFGSASLAAIKQIQAEIGTLNGLLGTTASAAGNISFGNAGGFDTMLMGTEFAPVFQDLPEQLAGRMTLAMQHLMSKGWSQTAASGIVGNLGGESGLNPLAINPGDGTDGSDSIGIAQWNAERARALKQFAAIRGKSHTDFLTQLDFLDAELRGTEASAGNALRMAANPAAASDIFMRKFERPSDKSIAESGPKRAGYAMQAYDLAGGAGNAPAIAAENTLLEQRNDLIETGVQLTTSLTEQNQSNADIERNNQANEWLVERERLLQDINTQLERAGQGVETGDNALQKVYDAIEAGKVGESTDINAREYTQIIAAAQRLDELNKNIADNKQLQTQIDDEAKRLEEERLELNRQIAEAQKAANDPNYKPESTTLTNLQTRLDAYLADVRQRYGEESRIYQEALATRNNMLQQQRQLEVTQEQATLNQEMQQRQLSLMTQTQQRQYAMQQQLAAVDAWVQRARAAGMEEVEITRQAEAQKAAIRQQYAAQMNPMTAQMQEWGDLQGQLAQKSTQWMDSLAGGITDLIMGTGDLRSVIQGIAKDMINMMVKYMMSGMKGGAGKGGAGGGAKAGKMGMGGGGAAKAGKGMFGVAHTGGIIGQSQLSTRRGSGSMFVGAPKFHGGGVIGPRLMPSEVPIIAQEGEGVFTKDQMANLQPAGAGNQTIAINSPITVNGSAGTPEQNNDLAKQMRREMEAGFRAIAADEMRKQTKAGNMLNTRSRS